MRAAWGAHTATGDDSPPGTARCLAAAAGNLAAGRDLRHTYLTTDQFGGRHGTSPWAAAIASRHVNVALAGGGTQSEIDLNKKNARTFRKQLAPFAEHARRAGRGQRRPRTSSTRRRSGDIRAWANQQGIAVSGRGRIPASVVEQYDAAAGGS